MKNSTDPNFCSHSSIVINSYFFCTKMQGNCFLEYHKNICQMATLSQETRENLRQIIAAQASEFW